MRIGAESLSYIETRDGKEALELEGYSLDDSSRVT